MGKETAGHTHPDKHHDHQKSVPDTVTINEQHLDFSKKHPIFEIELEKKGPEFSAIDDLRDKFIAEEAGNLVFEVPIPKNIVGISPSSS